ncbi:hypothetical protein TURU_017134 [Turdus rufiventris]|nr:hypothetical protein TURU_017134 [Turdus rufiventris]
MTMTLFIALEMALPSAPRRRNGDGGAASAQKSLESQGKVPVWCLEKLSEVLDPWNLKEKIPVRCLEKLSEVMDPWNLKEKIPVRCLEKPSEVMDPWNLKEKIPVRCLEKP